jgi:predicted AAA+ superfamily ATPase
MAYKDERVQRFDDETILRLFGAQAAEDETFDRLSEYFIRNKAYERLRSDIKLRLLVGHKGIGKSALLKMAHNRYLSR